MGLEWEVREPGVATATISVVDLHLNPNGVVHGGVLFAALDTVMGAAVMSVVDEGEACSTVDLHVRYHAAARSGMVKTTARILHAGRRLVALTGESVHLESESLLASATGTFIRLAPRADHRATTSAG